MGRLAVVTEGLRRYMRVLRGQSLHPPQDAALGEVLSCPVFVINLERSTHRRQFMSRYLADLGIQPIFFPAINGATLDFTQLQRDGIYDDAVAHRKFSRSLSPGEVGCTLSHVGVYRRMVEENIPMAMVLEDDVMLVPGVADKLRRVLAELPADWDLLQLYYHCKEHENISPHVVRFPAKTCMPVGALGIVIRKAGAEKMLRAAYPVCYPADSLIGRSPRWGVTLYGSLPTLVGLGMNYVFPTEIHTQRGRLAAIRHWLKRTLVSAFAAMLTRR